jgi:hypothetical protein
LHVSQMLMYVTKVNASVSNWDDYDSISESNP